MDKIAKKLKKIEWQYAEKDQEALTHLINRVRETANKKTLIAYSDLVKGIDFHYPNINEGKPYRIQTYDWSGLDRRILGDCLGFISTDSYLKLGFMASSVVVSSVLLKPSDIFFEWVESLGLLDDLRQDSILKFWVEQVRKTHEYYGKYKR